MKHIYYPNTRRLKKRNKMDPTIMWVIIGALAVLGVGALLMRKKASDKIIGLKRNMFVGIALILAVALGAMQMGYLAGIGLSPFAITSAPQIEAPALMAVSQETAQSTPTGKCYGVDDVTVTLSSVNADTNVPTGGSHRYKVNGAPALTVSNAGTLTASPGQMLEVMWYNESLTGGYFSAVDKFEVPCSSTKTFSKNLYMNGTRTIKVFNEEGNLITSSTNNETLDNGDVVTLTAQIVGQYQKGMPYGGVIVADYNMSSYDDVVVNFGGSKVSTPNFYKVSSVDSTTKSYSVPAIMSNQILQGSVMIDVDDTFNPSESTTGEGVITLSLYPYNYYVNEDKAGSFEGPAVEDEDDAQRSLGKSTFTISVL